MQIPQSRWRGFFTALYQFLAPTISYEYTGRRIRLQDLCYLSNIDLSILEGLDSPPLESDSFSSRTPLSGRTTSPMTTSNSQYKDVRVVRPPLPPSNQPVAGPSEGSSRAPTIAIQKPSGKRQKRTKSTEADKGQSDENPSKKRKRKESTIYWDKLKEKREYPYCFDCGVVSSILTFASFH